MASQHTKCCTIGFFKYLFHVFNIIFLVSGLGVLAVGIWSVFWRDHLIQIQNLTYTIIVHTVFIVGISVTIVNIIGYIGVWKENRCTIQYYICFLIVIFVLGICLGVACRVHVQDIQNNLGASLNETFVRGYEVIPQQTEAIDSIQKELKCCGAIRFEDWKASQWYKMNKNSTTFIPNLCRLKRNVAAVVPMSCCKTPSPNCGCSDHPNNIYYNGCVHKLKREIQTHMSIVEWISFFIAGLQLLGLLLSCILCNRVKHGYY